MGMVPDIGQRADIKLLSNLLTEMLRTQHASRCGAAASLAAGIVAASGRPHSVNDALSVYRDVFNSLFGDAASGQYRQWKEESAERLDTAHT